MAMLNPKTQGCSGNLLVKLQYVLCSMTLSSSLQAVECWWIILRWKRCRLWAPPGPAQDEPLLCVWTALLSLVPRFPTWLLQELTVCAVTAGNAPSKHPLEPLKNQGPVCVIDFWTLLSFRIFAYWQKQNKSKSVEEQKWNFEANEAVLCLTNGWLICWRRGRVDF